MFAATPVMASPHQSNPAFLGIGMRDGPGGCVIDSITSGGPASEGRVEIGDIILAFDTVPLDQAHPCDRLVANITSRAPGDTVRLDVDRNMVHQVLAVTLSTRAEVLQKRVGERIATTDLVDVDDQRSHIDLGTSGKTRVVGWFTSQCAGCGRVFDRIADRLKDRANTGVVVLGVTERGENETLVDLRKRFGSSVPLAAADPETFRSLAMDEVDRAFFMVIDCKGVTRLVTAIAPDSDDLDGIVDEVLAGAEQAEHSRTNHK